MSQRRGRAVGHGRDFVWTDVAVADRARPHDGARDSLALLKRLGGTGSRHQERSCRPQARGAVRPRRSDAALQRLVVGLEPLGPRIRWQNHRPSAESVADPALASQEREADRHRVPGAPRRVERERWPLPRRDHPSPPETETRAVAAMKRCLAGSGAAARDMRLAASPARPVRRGARRAQEGLWACGRQRPSSRATARRAAL